MSTHACTHMGTHSTICGRDCHCHTRSHSRSQTQRPGSSPEAPCPTEWLYWAVPSPLPRLGLRDPAAPQISRAVGGGDSSHGGCLVTVSRRQARLPSVDALAKLLAAEASEFLSLLSKFPRVFTHRWILNCLKHVDFRY